MEIQRRRMPDWVHAPETSPPLEHAGHVQSLNAISCIPSVTEMCTIKQRILKSYLLTVKKSEYKVSNPKSHQRHRMFPVDTSGPVETCILQKISRMFQKNTMVFWRHPFLKRSTECVVARHEWPSDKTHPSTQEWRLESP
jgi:hypothetical protein